MNSDQEALEAERKDVTHIPSSPPFSGAYRGAQRVLSRSLAAGSLHQPETNTECLTAAHVHSAREDRDKVYVKDILSAFPPFNAAHNLICPCLLSL